MAFQWAFTSVDRQRFYSCGVCGAVVDEDDVKLHEKFHREIQLIDVDVRSAHARGRDDRDDRRQ
jgi:hypothetical protein